jgi:hypothetical protein
MTIADELTRVFASSFRVLIFDNEVTVDAFVTEPPLPWARLTAKDDQYGIIDSYPTALTLAEADREELNWDRVSSELICAELGRLTDGIDMIAFGNNAAQGFPLAQALPPPFRSRGVIVYGRSLPEQAHYEALGYRKFCTRSDLLEMIAKEADSAGRPPALGFINTIEHNERNYHTPWNG